jgi:hypothetical protein
VSAAPFSSGLEVGNQGEKEYHREGHLNALGERVKSKTRRCPRRRSGVKIKLDEVLAWRSSHRRRSTLMEVRRARGTCDFGKSC